MKTLYLTVMILLSVLFIPKDIHAQSEANQEPIYGKLIIEESDFHYLIKAVVANQSSDNQSIDYKMELQKISPTTKNRSKNVQSGKVLLNSQEEKTASQVKMNQSGDDIITIKLTILHHGEVISIIKKEIP